MVSRFLNIDPRPAERARRGRGRSMFTPATYRLYQKELVAVLLESQMKPDDYAHLEAVFFIHGEPEGVLIRKDPDTDNYTKALKDCLQKSEILLAPLKRKTKEKTHTSNDAMIASEHAIKIGSGDNPGGIFLTLLTETEYFHRYGNPIDIFISSDNPPSNVDLENILKEAFNAD